MYCYAHCPQPCSKLPPTHAFTGDSWTLQVKPESFSCGGHCSFLLGPGAQGSVGALQESISQSCVMVRLLVTFSKRAYAIPKSAAPRTLHQWQSTADLYLHRRHSNTVLSSSVSVSLASLVQIFSFNDIEQFNYNY